MKKILIILLSIIFILLLLALLGIIKFYWDSEDAADEYAIFARTCKFIGIALSMEDRIVPIISVPIFCMNI